MIARLIWFKQTSYNIDCDSETFVLLEWFDAAMKMKLSAFNTTCQTI
jgi:hypothetical protein